MRIAVAFLASTVAAACGTSNPSTSGAVPRADDAYVRLNASWAWAYRDLSELQEQADVVILGQVSRIAYQGADPQDEGGDLPLTIFEVSVTRILKGLTDNTILVGQTGGPVAGRMAEVNGDPLMREGEQFVMYLRRITSGPSKGRYTVLGGPQGRLAVGPGGTLSKVGDSAVSVPKGLTLDTLVATP
ncbi:MAG: hypothetical protein WD830_09490 [Chloroflexota bacterium]